jgi:F0F1-type ATP synthase assembly protein I
MSDMTPQKEGGVNDRRYLVLALRIASDFGVSIAAPVVVFSLAGRWLDRRFDTGSFWMIAGFAVSAALSALIVYHKAKAYAKEYRDLDRRDPPTI